MDPKIRQSPGLGSGWCRHGLAAHEGPSAPSGAHARSEKRSQKYPQSSIRGDPQAVLCASVAVLCCAEQWMVIVLGALLQGG